MALMNRNLCRRAGQVLETVYLMPDERYTYLSSTTVKEVSRLGGDISNFVPDFVEKELNRKFRSGSRA
jgi:pantetheine-phosphate adenylyltransferase